MKLAEELASEASAALKVSGQDSRSVSAYFNKGIVASQWVARELEREGENQKNAKTTLKEVVSKPGDPLRDGLSGLLRPQILSLLEGAKNDGGKVFAALYELNDPELLDGLRALGKNANLILGNGAFKPPDKDENADIRNQLKQEGRINVFDRIVSSGHFAHNKFVVFCDAEGKARRVLSGSTNWTVSGLCTQANNGIIIEDDAVADWCPLRSRRILAGGNKSCSARAW